MTRAHKSGPCVVFRPGETGDLVRVGVQRAAPAGIRSGPFVVWDDLCQATRTGDTLGACAQYVCEQAPEDFEQVCYFGAGRPQPLNAAERTALRKLIQEGSE